MKSGWFRAAQAQILLAVLALEACNGDDSNSFTRPWSWSELGGPEATVSEFVGNHEPLVVIGTQLLLGTRDGIWQRPLSGAGSWQRAGLAGFAVHALAATADGTRLVAAGFDPDDETAPTVWYSTDPGAGWTAAAVWPRGEPGEPAGRVFPFYSLEPDPEDPDVIYGGLSADSLAVTVDGGATWLLTDGATAPNFGDTCVPHRSASAPVLLQGCELPLDIAWVGARRIMEEDRFALPDFRFLYGYPDFEELENRRINSIVGVAEHDDRVLVGVEGGLVELTSQSGEWADRSDVSPQWIFRAQDGSTPYAYIRAIAVLDDEGEQLLFGGTVNGVNTELSLFESVDRGRRVRQLQAPLNLNDPRVEQAVRLGDDDVLLVISEVDPDEPDGPHYPKVFRLRRP